MASSEPIPNLPPATGGGVPGYSGAGVSSALQALADVTREMERMRAELDSIVALVKHALSLGAPNSDFENMFIRAQRFLDRTVAEAEEQKVEILTRAYARAEQLVAEGRQQAEELVDRAARCLVLAPQALEELGETIDSFTQANDEVIRELTARRR
jgi:cell division septum initiation protein DivIVA